MQTEGLAREFANRVQRLRKSAQLQPSDDVTVYYDLSKCGPAMSGMVTQFSELIFGILKQPMKPYPVPASEVKLVSESFEIKTDSFALTLTQRGPKWSEAGATGPAKAAKYAAATKAGEPAVPHVFIHRADGKCGVLLMENPAGQNAISSYEQFESCVSIQ